MKGGESYRVIHAALVAALRAGGIDAQLSGTMPPAAGGECFLQPVEHDVLDAAGRKIAGAGQRRTVRGLLHQGSVAAGCRMPEELASAMSETVQRRVFEPDPGWLAERIETRYSGDGRAFRR
jgi:lipoate-protein ligase A